MTNRTRTLLLGTFAVLWLLFVMVAYAATHKPFDATFLLAFSLALWRVALAAGTLAVAGGVGRRLLGDLDDDLAPPTRLAFQAALGLGLLGLGVFALGVVGLWHPLALAAALLLTGLLVRREIVRWGRDWRGLRPLWEGGGALGRALALGSAFLLLCTLTTALAPPLKWDALTYHLTLPRAYLLAGRLVYVPEIMHWGMPQQTEMLYTLAMALGGAEAAATLGWAIGALTLVGLLGFAAQRLSPRAAWVTLAALLAGGTLSASLAWAYVEWPLMLYGLATLIALVRWREGHTRRALLLAGLFGGFALATKYTAGMLFLFGAALTLWDALSRRRSLRGAFGDAARFLGLGALVAAPYLAKNALATGSPFYPLLFPAGAMDSFRLEYYQGGAPWGTWLDALLLPWSVTFLGREGGVGPSASIGPLLLGLGALAWVGARGGDARRREMIGVAALFTLGGFLLWAVVSRFSSLLIQTRLYVAFFPAWALLAGAGFEAVAARRVPGLRFGRLLAALVLLAFGLNLIETATQTLRRGAPNVLLGLSAPEAYRTRNLGAHEAAMAALRALPPDSRTLMLWETRALSCWPRCDPDEVIDRWYADVRRYRSPARVLQAWREAGYTHLLLYLDGAAFVREHDPRLTPDDWANLDALLDSLPAPQVIEGTYALYTLE